MRELVDRARAEGVTRLLAYVGADNPPVLGWIARAGGVAEARAATGSSTASRSSARPGNERAA